jgi:hypothetical protein
MSLKKDLIKVGSVNILVFISGIINAFIIPKYLSISDYSSYKTYLLCVGFIGVLHFGFVDGINLYFGGKDKNEIDKKEFQALFLFILILELFVSILLFIVYLAVSSEIIFLFLIFSITLAWASWSPWEKFSRKISAPAITSSIRVSSLLLAGPTVAKIFVLLKIGTLIF